MKKDLIRGWISTILAIVGILLIVFCICIGNWASIPMCAIALLLNVGNAVIYFHEYERRKQERKDCMERFEQAFNDCWGYDDNRIAD